MVGAAIASAFCFSGCQANGGPAPSGPHEIRTEEIALDTARGTYPVEIYGPDDVDRPAPLILYAPGWGNDAGDSRSLLRELASHGYVVAAYDDLSFDDGIAGETEQNKSDRHAGFAYDTPAAYRASKQLAARRMELALAKSGAVLDAVLAEPDLAKRIDANRIGFVGFSFGGATAAAMAARDPRISVAVNLDGWLFADPPAMPKVPYLLISIPEDFPPASWANSSQPSRRALHEGALADQTLHRALLGRDHFAWLLAEGMEHSALNDQSQRWSDPGFRALKTAQFAAVLGFIDAALLQEAPPSPLVVPGVLTAVDEDRLLPLAD